MNFDDNSLWLKIYEALNKELIASKEDVSLKDLMKMLSVLENVEEAQNTEGEENIMLSKEQLEGLRGKAVQKLSKHIKDKETELSNQELTSLLRLALKHIRSQDEVFEMFDEVLSERVSSSGISNAEFA